MDRPGDDFDLFCGGGTGGGGGSWVKQSKNQLGDPVNNKHENQENQVN